MRVMIMRASARKRLRDKRQRQPEPVRSFTIPPGRRQPRINGRPIPWLISEDGVSFTLPTDRDCGRLTIELLMQGPGVRLYDAGDWGA